MLEGDHYLHYDLSFLEVGQQWHPKGDKRRLDNYKYQQEQFELEPANLLRRTLPKGLVDITDYTKFVEFNKMLGYPRLLTLKTTDMVIGEPPVIMAEARDEITEKIKEVRNSTEINSEFKKALIDYSRFGVMLLRVYKRGGKAAVTAWDPNEWVPVFYPDGTNKIHYNVIGWIYNNILTVQIHDTEDGSYEIREYELDAGNCITKLIKTEKHNTSGRCMLYAITNTPTTTNPLGTSDYTIINGLLQKAIERLTAILRVLDEHADPSMTGPYSLLSQGEKGELVFKTSKYYATNPDEPKPAYLTWEANLDSSFKAFETLMEQIYVLSEMGQALIGVKEGTGNVVSGTAMRFKMISPLEKARRIQQDLTEPLKKLISMLLYLEDGIELDAKDINIAWKDSLPKDPKEVADLIRTESGSVATKPLIHSLMDNYNLDKETAMHYEEGIKKFQEEMAGIKAKIRMSYGTNDDPSTGTDGRSHPAGGPSNVRKQDSIMNPASSENRGDDEN